MRAVLALCAVCTLAACGESGRHVAPDLHDAVVHRGRVMVVGDVSLDDVDGVEVLPPRAMEGLAVALRTTRGAAVRDAMSAAKARTLVYAPATPPPVDDVSVGARIARREVIPELRYLVLRPELSVLEPFREPPLEAAERMALARIARQLLAGSEPPRLSQLPSGMRAPVPTEVLLSVRRSGGALALWRSARSSSIASALLSAAHDARSRWLARETNLGTGLAALLATGTVEVSLLVEDGTLGDRAPGFLDAVMFPEHGPAYDRTSSWHYLLPDAPARRGMRGAAAFEALFADNQLPPDARQRTDLRLYRVRVVPLSVSPPEPETRPVVTP